MKNVIYIKFNSRQDQVDGFYELATKAKVISLPDGIYAIGVESLQLLDAKKISYTYVTDEELESVNDKIRNPLTVIL